MTISSGEIDHELADTPPIPPDDMTLPSGEIAIPPDQMPLPQDEVPILLAENNSIPSELQLPPPLHLNHPPYSTHAHSLLKKHQLMT